MEHFIDRIDAGKKLAEKLEKYKGIKNVIVLGLPRGGVVIAFEVAKKLRLPLDIIVVRKIGAPGNPEFAIGAIDENGQGDFNQEIINYYNISKGYLDQTIKSESEEAARRLKTYRGNRKPLELKGKTAIIIDDGIATGSTMFAAVKSAKAKGAKKIIVAIPVAATDSLASLKRERNVNEVVVLSAPSDFGAVGQFYEEFEQTTDQEVIKLLYETSLK